MPAIKKCYKCPECMGEDHQFRDVVKYRQHLESNAHKEKFGLIKKTTYKEEVEQTIKMLKDENTLLNKENTEMKQKINDLEQQITAVLQQAQQESLLNQGFKEGLEYSKSMSAPKVIRKIKPVSDEEKEEPPKNEIIKMKPKDIRDPISFLSSTYPDGNYIVQVIENMIDEQDPLTLLDNTCYDSFINKITKLIVEIAHKHNCLYYIKNKFYTYTEDNIWDEICVEEVVIKQTCLSHFRNLAKHTNDKKYDEAINESVLCVQSHVPDNIKPYCMPKV
jgi:hypothetical protein